MEFKKKGVGLSLSGGGIRAAIFHLGALQYLAEEGLFDRIASISSVSGASLCMGAIFAANGNKWPSGREFAASVQPEVRRRILENNIQKSALLRLPFSPAYWWNRVELIAKILEEKWGVAGTLQDLPGEPHWEINCTTFETGKSFRFRRDFMGDYSIGYVQNPTLPVSHMIAASAGFPVLIGPYILKTKGQRWTRDKQGGGPVPVDAKYALWDGGVYDNLGLEALHKIGSGLDSEIDFLVVSNASPSIARQKRRCSVSPANIMRLLDIAMSQVDSLRSREVFASIISKHNGMYLKIGSSAEEIARGFKAKEKAKELIDKCLPQSDVDMVRDYATTLSTPTPENFELIFRHGYENAKCVDICRKIALQAIKPMR